MYDLKIYHYKIVENFHRRLSKSMFFYRLTYLSWNTAMVYEWMAFPFYWLLVCLKTCLVALNRFKIDNGLAMWTVTDYYILVVSFIHVVEWFITVKERSRILSSSETILTNLNFLSSTTTRVRTSHFQQPWLSSVWTGFFLFSLL